MRLNHNVVAHAMIVVGAVLCGVAFLIASSHSWSAFALALVGGVLVVTGVWWPPRRWR